MRIAADRLAVLLEHGLSEYQARVYLALLEFPSVAAGALAKSAQVPRNRLYEILEELQSIGLADVIVGETRTYRARPISSFLDRASAELRERIAKMEHQRAYMDIAFQPPALVSEADDLEAGSTRAVITRRAIAREIDRLVDGARTSIVASSSVNGWERVFRHLDSIPADGRVSVEIFVPLAARRLGGVERMTERWGEAVKWIAPSLRTISFAVDGRELLSVHPLPDDDALRVGRDFGILTTNATFLHDHVEMLRHLAVTK